MVKIKQYKLGKTLGMGVSGKVKIATDTNTGIVYAVKILNKELLKKKKMEDDIKREIAVMKLLKHPNIVKLHEVLESPNNIYLIIELITGGELFDKIVKVEHFDEDESRKFFQQLINGIQYCHQNGVMHRDLKPENLLVDGNNDLKITDFGFSKVWNVETEGRKELSKTACGTLGYCAPEVVLDSGYDGFISDIWSAGVILYAMLSGELPFDPQETYTIAKTGKVKLSYPMTIPKDARNLLDQIMVANPKKRITIDEILKDPWFSKGYEKKSSNIFGKEDLDVDDVIEKIEVTDQEKVKKKQLKPFNAFEVIHLMISPSEIKSDNTFMMKGDFTSATNHICEILKEMKAKKVDIKGNNIKVAFGKDDQMIMIHVNVIPFKGDVCYVTIKRAKGNSLLFVELTKIFLKKLKDVKINK